MTSHSKPVLRPLSQCPRCKDVWVHASKITGLLCEILDVLVAHESTPGNTIYLSKSVIKGFVKRAVTIDQEGDSIGITTETPAG